jgi:diadenosine tetraphosphate (Ap4A) HIT family hydrolase
MTCPFCSLSADASTWSSDLSFAIRDRHPVSPGHTLVIPHRHVETYFDATPVEQADLWRGVTIVKRALDDELHPDGYNVGFNAGATAGQTVPHLHVHVIPRFKGDMDDPRGGVRGVIPARQKYDASWAAPASTSDRFRGPVNYVQHEGEKRSAFRFRLVRARPRDLSGAAT